MFSKVSKSFDEWKSLFIEYQKSGMTRIDFCRKNKITNHQFYYWSNKVKKSLKQDENNNDPSFISIAKQKGNKTFSLKLPSGFELTFYDQAPKSWIINLISELEKAYAHS